MKTKEFKDKILELGFYFKAYHNGRTYIYLATLNSINWSQL